MRLIEACMLASLGPGHSTRGAIALLARERLTCKEPPALAAHGPEAAAFSVNTGLRPPLERNLA